MSVLISSDFTQVKLTSKFYLIIENCKLYQTIWTNEQKKKQIMKICQRVNATELLKVQSVLWKVIFPRNWAFIQSKSWYKAKGVVSRFSDKQRSSEVMSVWSSLFVITEDYFLPKVFEGTLMYPFIYLREVQNYVLLKTKKKKKLYG